MHYYEVAVASNKYHGHDSLTYQFKDGLSPGMVVAVPLRGAAVAAIVLEEVVKPGFATKPIDRVLDVRLPKQSLNMLAWLKNYYPAPLGVLTQQFLPPNLLATPRLAAPAKTKANTKAGKLPILTAEQDGVIKEVLSSQQSTFLLHGRTGSGKTRVYIELAREAIKQGRSVILLTPEIVLTPQLVKAFSAEFPTQVIITHSNLTAAQRRAAWLRIVTADKPLIVVGPRSAIFSPLESIGLIIMDECHEPAYKQEQLPYYQTSRAASSLARLHGARFMMGSATPLVTDYYYAEQKGLPILRIHEMAKSSEFGEAPVSVVDLRDKAAFSRNSFLSDSLINSIETALAAGEQALVYLNRRGTARTVLCQNCGWQATCPNCDLPLTYHGDRHDLRCHTCGHREPALSSCPSCGGSEIIFKSIGTKALTKTLRGLFPRAVIKRFDSDTGKQERLEAVYDQVVDGKVDILVGTQVLAKGLDLPRLSVVGVVMADTSLSFPDYTAEERTFQLLHQIMGRVGRGHRSGQVIVQTFNPESASLQAALQKDWTQFYASQLEQRKMFGFPPFYHLLKIVVSRASGLSAQRAAQELAEKLLEAGLKIEIIGPAPSFYEKQAGKYRWQLVIKAKRRGELIKAISLLPKNVTYDLDPSDLL